MATTQDLEAFVCELRVASRTDAAEFKRLLGRGIEFLSLTDKDIAREFGASRPTVTRWRNGDNAPHPAMRKPVFDWLTQRAQIAIRRQKAASPAQAQASALGHA